MKGLRRSIVLLCAAFFAALASHVAIDVLGDRLLAHDTYTYDAIGHRSRSLVALGALALALVAMAAALRNAFADARCDERRFCASLRSALPASPLRFGIEVIVVSFGLLVMMETLDASLAGQQIDGVADLVGGSLLLGSACAVVCGALAAALGWLCVARFTRLHGVLCALISAFVRFVCRGARIASAALGEPLRFIASLPVLACRIAGRAPPVSLSAVA